MRLFSTVTGFQWDDGNENKSLVKHGITIGQAEEVFFDEYAIVDRDSKHSQKEDRYHIIGVTKYNKVVFIVFTLRKDKIRVISSRVANTKEVKFYEKTNI